MMALNAERLSKQISLGALAVAIPLHLFIDPVAGLSVRAAAAVAFAAGAFSARRWPLTPAVVATAAAVAPVGLAALMREGDERILREVGALFTRLRSAA